MGSLGSLRAFTFPAAFPNLNSIMIRSCENETKTSKAKGRQGKKVDGQKSGREKQYKKIEGQWMDRTENQT